MKLLKNARAYRRWAKATFDTYNDRWNAEAPRDYPCYGYTVVEDFGMEETRPEYLYWRDVARMHADLIEATPC